MDIVRKHSDTAEMSAEQQARIIETLTEQIETEEMSDKRLALILEFLGSLPVVYRSTYQATVCTLACKPGRRFAHDVAPWLSLAASIAALAVAIIT